jgi:ketosteroid isomerase-like protein
MAEHPNVTRMRDGYAAFAKGDFAVLNDLFAEDVLWHVGGHNQLAKDYRGRDEVEAHVFHLRDGRVTEFWDASTDQAAFDELIG